jgi:branched-chain amino acid transport system permease protein
MFVVAILLTAGVFGLIQFTNLGLAMRAAAQNRRAAALMGVNPNRTITTAWILAGATAGIAGVLLAAATSLDPYSLPLQVLPAYVAVLIGGLESLPGVLAGSVVVGLTIGIVPALGPLPIIGEIAQQTGSPQVFLALLTFAVLARRGEPLTAADLRAEGT